MIPQLSEWIKHKVSRTFCTIFNFSFHQHEAWLDDCRILFCTITYYSTVFKLKELDFFDNYVENL